MSADLRKPPLGARFADAFALASDLHRDQVRKGTTIPYVSHLMAVAALVLEHGGGEDEAIAALLHDAAEDQGGLLVLARIRDRFGDRVADIVASLSDSLEDTRSADRDKADWTARKEAYLTHLREAGASAVLVSACDKLHNLRCLIADLRHEGDAVWARFNTGPDRQWWFYRAFFDAVRERAPSRLVADLGDALDELAFRMLPGGLAKAISIAARAHAAQTDKAGEPYVLHPLRMAFGLAGEDERIVAVLHDVIEDPEGWSLERLAREGFSARVVEAVECVTKREGEGYDAFIERAASNPVARAVKLADLEDNLNVRRLREIRPKDLERVAKYHRHWVRLRRTESSSGADSC